METSLFVSLIIVASLALIVPIAMLLLGHLIGPKRPTEVKYSAYECGVAPEIDAKRRFSVKFYQVAVLFVVFDVDIAFIFPWALLYGDSVGYGMFVQMMVFLAVLAIGLYYVVRRGALEWE